MKTILITLMILSTIVNAVSVTTDKSAYTAEEPIVVSYKSVVGEKKNWMALYKETDNNDWKNVRQWTWVNGSEGTHTFERLAKGNYEVRVFYNNTYRDEAKSKFSITSSNISIVTTSNKYTTEPITFSLYGFNENQKDWVGIYPKGSTVDWVNVIDWKWADDISHFNALPVGEYELRGFFKNSFHIEAKVPFTVTKRNANMQEFIEKAKTHCLEGDNSTATVLCANDNNTVYIFNREDSNAYIYPRDGYNFTEFVRYFDLFKISLKDESTETLRTERVELMGWHVKKSEVFFKKFENSPIYLTKTYKQSADETGDYYIQSGNKSVRLSMWYEWDNLIQYNTLKVSEDSKKLSMTLIDSSADTKTAKVYDISDLDNMKLISEKTTDIPWELANLVRTKGEYTLDENGEY
ncbi:MAG: No hits [uncultured Sulfurovum sp.]|uniref:No hits n=1 Tax=uncultured Sulfurovum sp. TaxID=269237 RepID=A0A6S6SVF4_9BACT|nr:MAG: No hits [uncultured Sulfurovum sp.]